MAPQPPPPPPPAPSAPRGNSPSALRRRRDELAEQVAEQQWDLGGLAYEMAIRDHFRLDVLVRRAAELQERDAELAEVERLLRLEETATVGACPTCAAPHSRGALFCWQCGATLMERASGAAAVPAAQRGGEQDTAVQRPAANPLEQGAVRRDTLAHSAVGQDPAEQDTLVVKPVAIAKE
ncbi:MAG TPA: hypothetical protein VID29_08180 [Solirubrobacteraceae bacterium]|jgi:hypothetical protein